MSCCTITIEKKSFGTHHSCHFSAIIILLISTFLCLSNGQAPAINDPFPGNHGPEIPKTTPPPYRGCPAECDKRLNDAMAIIYDLEQRITTLNITITSRLNNVPTGGSGNSNELTNRVINVENYLYGNMTTVTNKLNNDLTNTRLTLSQNITDTRNYLDGRITALAATSGGGGSSGGAGEAVYSNITKRLDNLEYAKVQTLIDENNVWRKNFEVVNRTFSKMRKSSYSNDVIVVG